jgi:hypothetical protein
MPSAPDGRLGRALRVAAQEPGRGPPLGDVVLRELAERLVIGLLRDRVRVEPQRHAGRQQPPGELAVLVAVLEEAGIEAPDALEGGAFQ